jgi:hypothetical protein
MLVGRLDAAAALGQEAVKRRRHPQGPSFGTTPPDSGVCG